MTSTSERLVADCTTLLFRAYSTPVHRAADTPGSLVAAIDARDGALTASVVDLRRASGASRSGIGKLLFVSSFAFVASSRPRHGADAALTPDSARDWIYVRDWTRELTNQLAGRVTNQLAEEGVRLSPGQPLAMTATAASQEVKSMLGTPLRFTSGPHEVRVWLDLRLDPESDTSGARSGRAALREGTITMFDEGES